MSMECDGKIVSGRTAKLLVWRRRDERTRLGTRAFSSEVGTGSREENASNKNLQNSVAEPEDKCCRDADGAEECAGPPC
jgi:hypothetical protein